MKKKIKLMILDDHQVVRAGLISYLNEANDIDIVGDFSKASDLMLELKKGIPDIVLMDYCLGKDEVDGINLLHSIHARFPDCRVLVVSAMTVPIAMSLLKRSGAKGFVGKSQSLDVLINGIRKIAHGHDFWPNTIDVIDKVDLPVNEDGMSVRALLDGLSPREREVIRCYLEGMSITEIAQKFSRSVKTISNQKQIALQKLGLSSDRELFLLDFKK